MSGNVKFRWFLLVPIVLALLVVVSSPVSWAGELEDAQARVRQNPNDAEAHNNLGIAFYYQGRYQEAIPSLKEAIRLNPNYAKAHYNLGSSYAELGQYQEAHVHAKEAVRLRPDAAIAHFGLGVTYDELGQHQKAIASYKEAIRIQPDYAKAHYNLGYVYAGLDQHQKAIASYKEALRIDPNHTKARNNLNELEQKIAQAKPAPSVRQAIPQPPAKQTPQSGTGSGFFVSKMGHVITNAHVVQNCKKITIGDNANKQVPAELINTDRSNDLALLKLSTLEMASAESKSLIQKLGIVVVPLASKGLLRSDDVRLGEKVLVAGYPFGELFSNTIKVTSGIVSATRGAGDDSGQFQLDAAVQPGNSGGPIYDSGGNIVGVVISQLDKLKMAKAIGSLPENVNFGIKASTVRQFLMSSGLPSKKSERTEEKSTEQLAEIAKNQALMVMCLQ
jgi:S1-C subfamily serine protease